MKKIVFLLLISLVVFNSCSSEDNSTDNESINAELLIGTWKITSKTYDGVIEPLDACEELKTLSFNETTVVDTYYYESSTGCEIDSIAENNYTVNGTTISIISDNGNINSAEIIYLSSSEFKVKSINQVLEVDRVYIATFNKI